MTLTLSNIDKDHSILLDTFEKKDFLKCVELAEVFVKKYPQKGNGFNILANKDEILPYSYSFLHASWIIVQNTKKESLPLLKSDILKNLYPSRFKLLNIYLKIILKKIYYEIKSNFIKVY